MKEIIKLKLFISYSHNDEEYIEEFIKHIAPLRKELPLTSVGKLNKKLLRAEANK